MAGYVRRMSVIVILRITVQVNGYFDFKLICDDIEYREWKKHFSYR